MLVHGIDIVETARIGKALDLWGERFIRRIYTAGEIEYCQGHVPALAARFAAKEAVMKALGTGNVGISWHDIEILPDQHGAPLIHLSGGAQLRARELGINGLTIALSHSRDYAIASAIGGCNEDRNR